jgi:arylsulfatase A-like enzyme
MDQGIGRILRAIDRRGDADNTLVLFFSDNGGVLRVASNGPQRGEKATPYQGGIRVAAVARWPQGGIEGGKVIDARMGYIDIMPTLKRIVGLEEEAVNPFDGLDVSDAIQGNETLPDRPWFTYYDQNDDRQEKLAVNYDTFKLVVHRPAPDGDYNTATDIELFAIQEDTQEADDRVAVGSDRGDELLAEINGFLSLKQDNQIERFRVGREGFVAPKDWEAKGD